MTKHKMPYRDKHILTTSGKCWIVYCLVLLVLLVVAFFWPSKAEAQEDDVVVRVIIMEYQCELEAQGLLELEMEELDVDQGFYLSNLLQAYTHSEIYARCMKELLHDHATKATSPVQD